MNRSILKNLQSRDPEGRSTEPTDLDRALFKGWVIDQYGHAVWVKYQTA